MSENRSAAETIYPAQTETAENAPAETPAPTTPETTASPETAAPETAPTLLTEKTEETTEAPAEPSPEPFDAEKITFPEEMKADAEIFGKFGEIAKESGMSQKTAQELVNLYHSVASSQAQQNLDAWKTTRESWVAAVKGDGEIGGSNLDNVKKTVAKILDDSSLTDPKFREALEVTGIGDHPAAIRSLYRWAKALSEGTHVAGNGPVLQQSPRSLAQNIYPHLSQTER